MKSRLTKLKLLLAFAFILLGLTPFKSFAQMDSTAILPIFERLQGIEKYAVKKDVPLLRALLEYKHDYDLFYVEEFYKQYMEEPHPYRINILDPLARYISYNASGMSDYTKKHWDLSDGSKLIGTETLSLGDFVEVSIMSFEKFENGAYSTVDASTVIPDERTLADYLVPGNTDPLDFRYVLPRSGQDILFCLADRCIRLKWNGETFTTDGKEEIKPEDPPLPYNFRIDQRRDTEHFLAFELGGISLDKEDREKVEGWEKGTILSNKDLDLLYGQFTANKMRSWYNLAMEVGSIEILDNQLLSEDTRAITFRFANESEDFVGDRIVIRILKKGSWIYEVSYLKGTLEGTTALKTSHLVDQQSIRIYPKSQTNELPIYYIPEIGQSTIDLPIQVFVTSSSNCFYLMKNSALTFECDPTESKRVFPLSEEGLQRVKKDGNYQYYIDEANKLQDTPTEKKEEIINYFKSQEEQLVQKGETENQLPSESDPETQDDSTDDSGLEKVIASIALLVAIAMFTIIYMVIKVLSKKAIDHTRKKQDISSLQSSGLEDGKEMDSAIRAILEQLEQTRIALNLRAKKIFPKAFRNTTVVIFLIFSTIMLIINIFEKDELDYSVFIFFAIVAIFLGLIFGGIYALIKRATLKESFANEFKQQLIPSIANLINPNLAFDVKGVDQAAFEAAGIFKSCKLYESSDLLTDRESGISIAEVHIEKIYSRAGDGLEGKKRETVFQGWFCSIPIDFSDSKNSYIIPNKVFENDIQRQGLIIKESVINSDLRELPHTDISSKGGGNYHLMSGNIDEAVQRLEGSFFKVLNYFDQKFGAKSLFIAMQPKHMYVALDYRKNLFEPELFLKESLIESSTHQRIKQDVLFVNQLIKEVDLLAQSIG